MNTRLTMVATAVVSLAVGYAIGQSQRPGLAASVAGGVVDPHAEHALSDEHAGHALEATAGAALQAGSSNKDVPASEEGAKARLNASPRHGEFAKTTANGAPVNMWVVYPERRDKAPVVVLIHGASGFNDWIRAVADQLAAEGFIAIAVDLLSGKGPGGGGSESFASRDDVAKAIQSLRQEEITALLNAARDYGVRLPAASGISAVLGFCFGGSQSFAYAVAQPNLKAAVVFYGSAPAAPGGAAGSFTPASTLVNIKAPVLGLYGGVDARINATIPATQAKMRELGKIYEPHIFEGAGHGFLMRQGEQNGANSKASEQAWPITIGFLKKYTEGRSSSSQ